MIEMPEERDVNWKGCDSARQPEVVLLNEKEWSYVQSRYDLTPRELQIAELICQGLRNGKIAGMLRIRPGTVRGFFKQYERFHTAPSTD